VTKDLRIHVNGRDHDISAPPDCPLLYVLRDSLGLHSAKFGCGLSECGACTVIIDGVALRSCVIPLRAAIGRQITTLEGTGTEKEPSLLQQAFIDEQAVQCGYCINGMIMAAEALLRANPRPSRDAIKTALKGNLCRCGTHMRIIRAVERAAKRMAATDSAGREGTRD
jgi:nicotinate dehydrogenase subunit A